MTEWLTSKEAAAYLKLHPKTLYRYVRAGKLQQYRPAGTGRPRFRREDLDALLEAEEQTGKAAQGES
jgi:excisionase family DNA binding protein